MIKSIIKYALMVLCAFQFIGCKNENSTDQYRPIFDQGNLKVISTSLNKDMKTMAVLYGNEGAYNAALSGGIQHVPGEKYIFVTWKYIENPRWFGSNISEDILSIESLNVENTGDGYIHYNYKVEKGNPLAVNGSVLNKKHRIEYLFGYRPSILP